MNNYYNATLGNWKTLKEDELRLKPQYTMNKGFFSSLVYIHICLPYFEKNYFNKNINLNILYYSHNYGSYPNFQVIGDILQLNYIPSINQNNDKFDELMCLSSLCNKQINNKNNSLYFSFKDDFKLANYYLFKYLKFNEIIYNEVDNFTKQFENKKVLGIHFRGTDKNKVKWITHINIDEFILIVNYHLSKNKYDILFISSDDSKFIKKIEEKYNNSYIILHYDNINNINNINNNSIHLNRLSIIENLIKIIKKNRNNIENLIQLENNLKEETLINRKLLQNVIINSFILSKCNCVLKTHSQVSAYSKIFNPELEIYRVNACFDNIWPECCIPLYNYNDIDDIKVKNLLFDKLKNECYSTK